MPPSALGARSPALLVTAGVGGLTLGLVRGGAWGWDSARTIGVLAAVAVLLGLFATGSAVVNMLGQAAFAVGVAMLVAVLGSPHGAADELTAFRHCWCATAGAGLSTALAATLLRRRSSRSRH